ncbi:MAG: PaaI family thioesterase [Nitriliruptoraceae bacterium]
MTDVDLTAFTRRLRDGETLAGSDLPFSSRFVDEALGLVIDEVRLDRVTGHLDADARHHQPFGLVHGGVWCAVVETLASIGGALQVADRGMAVGVHNATDLLRAHRHGRADAVAVPVQRGRQQQLWQVDIRDTGDHLLARGTLRLQNLDRPMSTA